MRNLLTYLCIAMSAISFSCNSDNKAPDEQDVIILMGREGSGYYDIVAMKADGTSKKILFAGGIHDSVEIYPKQASIGSDGKTLLFACNNDSGIWTYDLLSGNLTRIPNTSNKDFETPVFTKNMSSIYVFDDNNDKLIRINVHTGDTTTVYNGYALLPSLYANDTKLIVDYGWNTHVASMSTNGTGFSLVARSDSTYYYAHPALASKMGKIVAVKNYEDGKDELVMLNLDGSNETVLLSDSEGSLEFPTVNASENKIVYRNSGTAQNIVIASFSKSGIGSNIASVPTLENDYRIWRPKFCRMSKAVFEKVFSTLE